MTFNHLDKMKIQPARAKLPRAFVAICAFEIGRCMFFRGSDVPASAAFVGDEWAAEGLGGAVGELGVGEDGCEAVVDAERGAFEGCEEGGYGWLGGEFYVVDVDG